MLWQVLLACLAVGRAAADSSDAPGTVTAHPDGQCAKPLSNGISASFQFKSGFPRFDTYKAQSYDGAESPDNGGGWVVYWKFPQPAPGCRNILMVPYNQASHDESTPAPGGMELVNTDRSGCFSTTIRVDEDVLLSYCCGSGDCGSASLGTDALQAPLVSSSQPSDVSKVQSLSVAPPGPVPTISKREPAVEDVSHFAGSPAARAGLRKRWYYPAPPPPPQHTDCKFSPGTPFSRLGRQVVVSDFQLCDGSGCAFEVQHQTTMGTTLTSATDQTITNSVGASVSVEAGVDFIAEGKVSATISTDWSKAISTTTGKDISQSNTTVLTTHINVQPGNNVAVTFAPLFRCWTGAWDCGHGVNPGIDLCQPSLLSDGVTQDGYYRAVAAP